MSLIRDIEEARAKVKMLETSAAYWQEQYAGKALTENESISLSNAETFAEEARRTLATLEARKAEDDANAERQRQMAAAAERIGKADAS